MRRFISLFIVLVWGVMLLGCGGEPAQLSDSALAHQKVAAGEVQATLEAFVAQANRDAAEMDDVVYICEGTFDRIAFYVPLHTPPDLVGPEPGHSDIIDQRGPYPSSLPPGSARHKAWSEDVILAQQASSRFRLLEITSIEYEPGSKNFTATGLLERTVKKREAAVRIGEGIPAPADGYRLWQAEFVLETRTIVSPLPRWDFPTFPCAGQPYGHEDSSFESHPNWLEHTISELEQRPFEEELKVFSLKATYSTGKWSIRSSRPGETIPLLTAPDWSAGLSVDEQKSIFPPQVLELIPTP